MRTHTDTVPSGDLVRGVAATIGSIILNEDHYQGQSSCIFPADESRLTQKLWGGDLCQNYTTPSLN